MLRYVLRVASEDARPRIGPRAGRGRASRTGGGLLFIKTSRLFECEIFNGCAGGACVLHAYARLSGNEH